MAERTSAKLKRRDPAASAPKGASKKSASKPGRGRGAAAEAMLSGDAQEGGVTAENARLKADLAAARERIADLELRQTEITNRIAWVIDSLHNLSD